MGLLLGPGVGITSGDEAVALFDTLDLDTLWHLRADRVTVAAGVMTAEDVSGHGHPVTGSVYPLLTTFPGTAKASLYFDGSGQHLNAAGGALPATVGAIYTAVWVATFDDSASRIVWDLNTGGAGLAVGQGLGIAGTLAWKKTVAFSGTSTAVVATPHWVALTFKVGAPHTTEMRINGALVTCVDAAAQIGAPSGAGFEIGRYNGAAFPHKGHLPEAFLCLGALSPTRLAQIGGYMAHEWGTP